jgi:hypothetical protein
MLFSYPAFYFSSYVLPGDPQKGLRPSESLTRTTPCEPVSDFISSYSGVTRDPKQSQDMPGGDIIQRLLA